MTIVAKEVKTIIKVEISEEEFADQYHAMMRAISQGRYYSSKITRNQAIEFLTLDDGKQMTIIDATKGVMMNIFALETIRYIAFSQGMDADWIGEWNRHTHVYEAHFSQNGARL